MTAQLQDHDLDPPPVRTPAFARSLPWLLTVGGALGLIAALDLTYERLQLALDPSYVPTCSINPLLDCGTVASSDQASAFGDFPNTLLGVVSFSVVVTLGVLMLLGVSLPRPVRWGLQVGVLLGAGFVHWLVDVSVFQLGVLCPYCMVVWSVTIPIAWYVTLANAADGLFGERVAGSTVVRTLRLVHLAPVLLWFVAVTALIGVVFAEQWAAML
ncbi:vitamin K epoxide reductase family protein [Aquipuribacter sp. MA13-6]|uniref:vitamin K epoxide reductase family protein n=1 Tax=unclassified Aquipuribacter TaxID=2635084 RepID=UPI003EED095B